MEPMAPDVACARASRPTLIVDVARGFPTISGPSLGGHKVQGLVCIMASYRSRTQPLSGSQRARLYAPNFGYTYVESEQLPSYGRIRRRMLEFPFRIIAALRVPYKSIIWRPLEDPPCLLEHDQCAASSTANEGAWLGVYWPGLSNTCTAPAPQPVHGCVHGCVPQTTPTALVTR